MSDGVLQPCMFQKKLALRELRTLTSLLQAVHPSKRLSVSTVALSDWAQGAKGLADFELLARRTVLLIRVRMRSKVSLNALGRPSLRIHLGRAVDSEQSRIHALRSTSKTISSRPVIFSIEPFDLSTAHLGIARLLKEPLEAFGEFVAVFPR